MGYDREHKGGAPHTRVDRSTSGRAPGRRTLTEALPRRSGGAPLPAQLGAQLGAAVGQDLSSVRVHAGADAGADAEALGARAFTVGQDIHFGAGNYDPSSTTGVRLIAHEVAHTVQQGDAGAGPQCDLEVSEPGDGHEVEADRFADAFVAGGAGAVTPVGRRTVSRAVIQRQEGPREPPERRSGGPNVVGAPIISMLDSEDPRPGGVLLIVGVFDDLPSLQVTFERLPDDPNLQHLPRSSRPVIESASAEILSRGKSHVRVRIPDVTGKWSVVVRSSVGPSEAEKFEVRAPGENRDEDDGTGERRFGRLASGLLRDLLDDPRVAWCVRRVHEFTREQGQLRYVIGRHTEDVMVHGEPQRMRTLLLLDAQLVNGHKDMTITVSLADVFGGMSNEVLEMDDSHVRKWSQILLVNSKKDEKTGNQLTHAQLLCPELGAVIGATWDAGLGRVILTHLFRTDLSALGITPYYDTKAKQGGLRVDVGENESYELRGGEEGGSLSHTERMATTLGGRRAEFERTTGLGEMGDQIRLSYRGHLAQLRAEADLTFSGREPERGESLDVTAHFGVSDGKNWNLNLGASTEEGRLATADAGLKLAGDEKMLAVTAGLDRRPPGGDQWRAGVSGSIEVMRGRIELAAGLNARLLERAGHPREVEVRGQLAAEFKKLLDLTVKLEGVYRREFLTREEQWQASTTVSMDLAQVEVQLKGLVSIAEGGWDAQATLGLDVGGAGKQILKLLDEEDEHEFPLGRWRSDRRRRR